MKSISLFLAACSLPFLGFGCADTEPSLPTATPQEVAAAVIPPLPKDYQTRIRNIVGPTLKDPYSAVYRFDDPKPFRALISVDASGNRHFGWRLAVWVNSKNSFGAYVGEEIIPFEYADGHFVGYTLQGKLSD